MNSSEVRKTVETILRNLEPRQKFKPGVVEDAVRRVEWLTDPAQIIDAIELAFLSNRISINPRWDGSIG